MKKNKISEAEVFQTMLVLFFACMAGYEILDWEYLSYAGWLLGVVGIFSYSFSEKITALWRYVAEKISHVSSFILLSVIFYLFLTPLALLYRKMKKDPLFIRMPGEKSMWQEVNKSFSRKHFEKMW